MAILPKQPPLQHTRAAGQPHRGENELCGPDAASGLEDRWLASASARCFVPLNMARDITKSAGTIASQPADVDH